MRRNRYSVAALLGAAGVALVALALLWAPASEAQRSDSYEREYATTWIVDGFEDDDLDAYTHIDVASADADYSVVEDASLAREGSGVLQAKTGSNGDPSYLLSVDGLADYPTPGDAFGCWIRTSEHPPSTQRSRCLFGVPNETSLEGGYAVGFAENRDGFVLIRVDGPKEGAHLASTDFDVPAQTWFEVRIHWATDGTITAVLVEEDGTRVAALSATDTSYSAEGIGFNVNAYGGYTNVVHYDDYHLMPGSPLPLAPQNLVAGSSPDLLTVDLEWIPPADDGGFPLTEYVIYRAPNADGPYEEIDRVDPDETSYTDVAPPLGENHYRVTALNDVGESTMSNTGTACVPLCG